jgi:energy-coupling factor transport system permease protein
MEKSFTLYEPRDSGLHQLHPLTKLGLALSGVAGSLLLPGTIATYLTFVLGLLPLAVWGQIVRPFVRATWRVVWPFALSIFLIQGLFWTGGTPLVGLGPVSLKAEGLRFAALSVGRILLLVSSFTLLTLSTRPDSLVFSLTERGLPHTLSYVVLSAIQIVPRFQAKANKIIEAQQSRGLETAGSLRIRIRALLPLVEPLLLGSLLDIEERAIALEARGFGRRTPPTSLLRLHDTTRQQFLRWFMFIGVLLLAAARIWLW